MAETIRVAAAGDIHCDPQERERVEQAFERVADQADLVLLAGDLTTHGQLEQAAVLADVCREFALPVVAVLGNHDWHSDRTAELTELLTAAGITVLDRSHMVLPVRGVSVGLVGLKGFMGGFGGQIANFGEPLVRACYAEVTADVEALNNGLEAVSAAQIRIVLLHYAPTADTLEGEPPGIWAFLGTERLAAPIAAHKPDLVLHGHSHGGTFEGCIGPVPVYNVAVHVIGKDFWVFDLEPKTQAAERPVAIEVEPG
ncbi:MAG TPA: metallophosphoesterase [Gaiellaceae bacterium]|nr:metallophosphoesterase [Gaiellaceae bacterium]